MNSGESKFTSNVLASIEKVVYAGLLEYLLHYFVTYGNRTIKIYYSLLILDLYPLLWLSIIYCWFSLCEFIWTSEKHLLMLKIISSMI